MKNPLIIVLLLLVVGLWFWATADIAKLKFKNTRMNLVWLLIVVFFPLY